MFRRSVLVGLAGLVLAAPVRAQPSDNDASLEKLRLAKFVMPEFPEIVHADGVHCAVVTVAIAE
jgi:hypothetical protein